ncbi:hypothetical protein K4A83_20730 [Spirulina subsalsa FACHB-351]|uniref:Uncharacterized protein n=1 Tax=Spirulina subsalsa FACHB-351 TaxID=234711 RepID=A0ABT3LC52_9CYAN|nr:hypothetical protein [Spirulina subsalsa]MCW6038679.1 hypothetical protein [Spirulina subsalsa FACHB-351]
MSNFPPNTLRRLQKLPQIPSVWEGDRRTLADIGELQQLSLDGGETSTTNGDCILWVDGSEGVVRSVDLVSSEMGVEAIARSLLRAMENPQGGSQPARPQKIVVRDREIQFFLRGALQDLDINIDYVPDLPLIDELFRSFAAMNSAKRPRLPAPYLELLSNVAEELWELCPWDYLQDHQIITVTLNQWDVGTLYLSIMGMLGKEYGVLMYRSLESLRRFRSAVINNQVLEELEEAFLSQDCWYLNYESGYDEDPDEDDEDFDLGIYEFSEIEPIFGSVHPYEGIRPFLDEEESLAVYVTLRALTEFVEDHEDDLNVFAETDWSKITDKIRIPLPPFAQKGKAKSILVEVATQPELSQEFLTLEVPEDEDEEEEPDLIINHDLVPNGSMISLGFLSWSLREEIQQHPKKYTQTVDFKIPKNSDGLPIILVQTTRSNAQAMINLLKGQDGLDSILFNPGVDSLHDTEYELILAKTVQETLYLIRDVESESIEHKNAKKKWRQRLKKTGGICGLVIAMGVTGASRGTPGLTQIMGLFEAESKEGEETGLGCFQLIPQFPHDFSDFDWDD